MTTSSSLSRIRIAGRLFLLSWAVGLAVTAVPAQDSVPFSFSLRNSRVTLHEPVIVELTVENKLSDTIKFQLGFNRKANFRLNVLEPGHARVLPPGLKEGGFGRLGDISVGPSETFKQNVLLNEWYEFPQVGTYQIQLKLVDLALNADDGTLLFNEVSSTVMHLEVQPRDPKRLAAVCKSLAESTGIGGVYAKQIDDAMALSYVVDPVAIPYLIELTRNPLFYGLGVRGLARIASTEGVEEVFSKLGTTNPNLRGAVRQRLDCIKRGCINAD